MKTCMSRAEHRSVQWKHLISAGLQQAQQAFVVVLVYLLIAHILFSPKIVLI